MVGLAEKIGCVFPRFLCVCLVRKGAEFAGFQMPKKHKDSEKVFVLAEKQKVCYSETKQKRKQTPFQFKLKQKNTTKMNKQRIS